VLDNSIDEKKKEFLSKFRSEVAADNIEMHAKFTKAQGFFLCKNWKMKVFSLKDWKGESEEDIYFGRAGGVIDYSPKVLWKIPEHNISWGNCNFTLGTMESQRFYGRKLLYWIPVWNLDHHGIKAAEEEEYNNFGLINNTQGNSILSNIQMNWYQKMIKTAAI
jgi:hypothetical protein